MAGGNKNKLLVPRAAEDAVDKMKEEISQEFNVGLDANTTARENGSVGDEIVKRMIKIAEESMNDKINNVLMRSCTGLFFHPCYQRLSDNSCGISLHNSRFLFHRHLGKLDLAKWDTKRHNLSIIIGWNGTAFKGLKTRGSVMKPLIGITPSMEIDEANYMTTNDNVRAVVESGGLPVIVPYLLKETDIEEIT